MKARPTVPKKLSVGHRKLFGIPCRLVLLVFFFVFFLASLWFIHRKSYYDLNNTLPPDKKSTDLSDLPTRYPEYQSLPVEQHKSQQLSRDLNAVIIPKQIIPDRFDPPMPWSDFVKMPLSGKNTKFQVRNDSINYANSHITWFLPEAIKKALRVTGDGESMTSPYFCSDTVEKSLSSPFLNDSSLQWCKWALDPSEKGGQVKVGSSWGRLITHDDRSKYDLFDCNTVSAGKNPTCDDNWGDISVKSWAKSKHPDVTSSSVCSNNKRSGMECFVNDKKDTYCVLHKAQINFALQRPMPKDGGKRLSREFESNFISIDCSLDSKSMEKKMVNAFPFPYLFSTAVDANSSCDYIIPGNVLLHSHDNILNMGHTMEDLLNVWLRLWLDNGSAKSIGDITLLSIDALRLNNNFNDIPPPSFFQPYYQNFKDFFPGTVVFGNRTVCFERLMIQPHPSKSFVWESWNRDLPCTFLGPSSLYQRWNLHVRYSYGLLDEKLLQTDRELRVLLIDRKENHNDWGTQRSSRIILNMEELNKSLGRSIHNWEQGEDNTNKIKIHFVVKDLASISYIEQLRLISSTSIIVGMHGAGISHLMHMSIGTRYCCGVIEIFPKGLFSQIRGHGNMARKMGLMFSRIDVDDKNSHSYGTTVPVEEVSGKVITMINAIVSSSASSYNQGSSEARNVYNPHCVRKDVAKNPFLEH